MAPEQDWCLACGMAAGRLGARPGSRSALTVLGLTGLLLAGAVAASYAALREDRTVPGRPAAAAEVAQAPPPATTAPPSTATTPPPASTTTRPSSGSTTGSSRLPKVKVPTSSSPPPAPSTSSTPIPAPSPPVTSTPRTSRTPTPTPTRSTPTPAPTPPSSGGGGSQTTTPGAGQTTTPAPTAPTAIDLDASAASVYDPYRRAIAIGVPGKALDGDGSTSWYADTPPGSQQVGLGFVVSLGQSRGIRSVDITTPTPGFRVEVYATDEAAPPPTILDTRWAHITDKSNVGEGGKTHIVLGAGTSKYQTLLLWITKPPTDGARVRISELKVFG